MSNPTPTPPDLRDTILDVAEALLKAQLSAIQSLRQPGASPRSSRNSAPDKGRYSQVDAAFDILSQEPAPLHVSDIILKAKDRGLTLDRESLVSALTKRVLRADRFVRTAPNTFGLLHPAPLPTRS
jgi:hypothetical protein